ncbi:hypothetical protein AgCh_032970 [Apium graveolens]
MDIGKTKGGSMGLSYPMLTRVNYTVWAMKMKVLMQAHGVWEAIEKEDPKTPVEERMDKVALAMIYQSIPEEMLLSLSKKKQAKNAWEALQTMCQGADRAKAAKVQTLKTEFEALNMKDAELLDDFSLKLVGLVTNIRALGEDVKEAYVVMKLLRAVPTKFLPIASTLEQFGNLETMTLEETIGSLKVHEERIKGSTEITGGQVLLTEEEWIKKENSENKLLLTREEWKKRMHRGGAEGNSGARGRGGRDKSRIRCYNCHIYGHYAAECRKPNREKEVRQEALMAQTNDDEPTLLLAKHDKECKETMLNEGGVTPVVMINGKEIKISSNVWYLDNGASNHMSDDREKFMELNEGITGSVKFGDGSTVKIQGKGSINFKCKNGEERMLHEVYYIPSLYSNIISLGQLSEEGNEVILKGNYLWVYEKKGSLLMKVKRSQNRLYKLLDETVTSECLLSKLDEVSRLWHVRLGHVNQLSIALMKKNNMVYGLPNVIQSREVCKGCLNSKQTRKPCPRKATYSASKVLQLVHGDLCGPIEPTTLGGNKYFFLLMDDISRVMWVYIIKRKDEAFGMFKKFRAQVENGAEKRIKTFRTDHGGEFNSNEFKTFYEDAGIERHFTAPYTPQQNGVVERRNRTVIKMTRCFLKEMGLPANLWGEAVRHSVYVLN